MESTTEIEVAMRDAEQGDLSTLTQYNLELYQDAGSPNPMTQEELCTRISTWLDDAVHRIVVFTVRDAVIGYAVYRIQDDLYDADTAFIYIRQFFIIRAWRNRSIGTQAYHVLMARMPVKRKIVVDVFPHNTRAMRFWTKLGFGVYSHTLMANETEQASQ